MSAQLPTLAARRNGTLDPDGTVVLPIRVEPLAIIQDVLVRHSPIAGRSWLLVFAEVYATSQLDSVTAVAHSATLGIGALASRHGSYFLQHAVPVSAANEDLDLAIDLIAHEAARLRLSVAPAHSEPLFANYAE